jgi:hypothetical protein
MLETLSWFQDLGLIKFGPTMHECPTYLSPWIKVDGVYMQSEYDATGKANGRNIQISP